MADLSVFLDRPGVAGACGALMDEYARAAEDFCVTLEAGAAGDFTRQRESRDPDAASLQALAAHVVGAAHRYADYIRKARGLSHVELYQVDPAGLGSPRGVRPRLAEALRYTEGALEGLYEQGEAALAAIGFVVRWGPTYDAEMLLEHAIVHLLRHRRQVTRWSF